MLSLGIWTISMLLLTQDDRAWSMLVRYGLDQRHAVWMPSKGEDCLLSVMMTCRSVRAKYPRNKGRLEHNHLQVGA